MSDKSASDGGAIEPFGLGPRFAPFKTTFSAFAAFSGFAGFAGFATIFSTTAGVTLLFDAGTGFTFRAGLGTDFEAGLGKGFDTGFTEGFFATALTIDFGTGFTALAAGFAAGLTAGLTAGLAAALTGFFTDFTGLATGFLDGIARPQIEIKVEEWTKNLKKAWKTSKSTRQDVGRTFGMQSLRWAACVSQFTGGLYPEVLLSLLPKMDYTKFKL